MSTTSTDNALPNDEHQLLEERINKLEHMQKGKRELVPYIILSVGGLVLILVNSYVHGLDNKEEKARSLKLLNALEKKKVLTSEDIKNINSTDPNAH